MDDRSGVLSVRVVAQLLIFIVLVPFLPIIVSGHWRWIEAWVYGLLNVVGFAASRALAARRHPDLLAERARSMRCENAEPWDKVLAPLVGLGGGLIPLVVGLDARFGWSPEFSPWVKTVAFCALLAGYVLGTLALMENRWFSGVVRIQADRDQHVVSSGPYAWVRHPGYAGALVTYFATPVFLDAVTAYIPVALMAVALLVRTNLEDSTLQAKLPGYRDYASRVRYRLVPGLW
jgi:protein-S-isoprenylcysteine O-methyltransferase Ste14